MRLSSPSLPALLVACVAVACSDPPTEVTREPVAEPAAEPVVESSGTTPRPPAQAARAMPHGNTAAEQLGTLPDGVGIAVGEQAPDARVQDADGRSVQLRELFARGPVMLVFYRGGWCPFCNFQIRELTEDFPELERRGVTPVAISVDRMEESTRTRANYTIPFPVLSDPDLTAHRAYRVTHDVDAAEVERLRGMGMDLERSSGRSHHVVAIPSVFVIDGTGVVRWAHADRDYRTRPSNEQLLAVIDGLELASGE